MPSRPILQADAYTDCAFETKCVTKCSRRLTPRAFNSVSKRSLRSAQRQRAQVFTSFEQQIKREQHQFLGFLLGQRSLQRTEAREAVLIERHDFSVDHAVREHVCVFGNGGESIGPIQTGAGADAALTVQYSQLRPIAIEFDLMRPSGSLRRAVGQPGELRFHEIRDLGDNDRLAHGSGFGSGLGSPYGVGPRRLGGCRHERLRALAGAVGNLLHGSPRGNGTVLLEQFIGIAGFCVRIPVLDQ